jgi:hypothetical protein
MVALPARGIVPMPPFIEAEVAPVMFHSRVEDCPAVTVPGEAVNEVIIGVPAATTDTVVAAVVLPEVPPAVRVYVVFSAGVTSIVPCRETEPTPWSIVTDVAPLTFHCRVDESPARIIPGLLVKDLIVTFEDCATVTVTVAFSELAVPVAVRV